MKQENNKIWDTHSMLTRKESITHMKNLPQKIVLLEESSGELNAVDFNILANKFNALIDFLSPEEGEKKYKSWEETLISQPQTTESKVCKENGCNNTVKSKGINILGVKKYGSYCQKHKGTVHSADQKETTGEEWERKMEDLECYIYLTALSRDQIKSFISTLLKEERERVRGIIEKLPHHKMQGDRHMVLVEDLSDLLNSLN